MPFQEDFNEFLDIEQGFAIEATVTSGINQPRKIKGILINDYLDIDAGMSSVAGRRVIFECAELQLGYVDTGDLITIKNVTYQIIVIKPDNCGWVSLLLERQ